MTNPLRLSRGPFRLLGQVVFSLTIALWLAMVVCVVGADSASVPIAVRPIPLSESVMEIRWAELAKQNQLPQQTTLDEEANASLKISRLHNGPQLIPITVIDKPKLALRGYMLRGAIQYEGVVGLAYLELWNHFPAPLAKAAFSRTLAMNGPMGMITGDSPWREFQVPFLCNVASFPLPERLELNLFLPDAGTVWISDLELVEFPLSQATTDTGIEAKTALAVADVPKTQASGVVKSASQAVGSWYSWQNLGWMLSGAIFFSLGITSTALWSRRQNKSQERELRKMRALNIE
jgi:hypothetical protein